MKSPVEFSILFAAAIAAGLAHAPPKPCALNLKSVRAWLRGSFTGVNCYRDYQDAAAGVGKICQGHPSWLLEVAARHWVERAR
jgi:hypothetical protein